MPRRTGTGRPVGRSVGRMYGGRIIAEAGSGSIGRLAIGSAMADLQVRHGSIGGRKSTAGGGLGGAERPARDRGPVEAEFQQDRRLITTYL